MITEVIPRHGARLVRLTITPRLSAPERVTWVIAREWPAWGAIAAFVILVAAGHRVPRWELDPALVAGYILGLLGTRYLARGARITHVRLDVVTVRREPRAVSGA